MDVRQFAFLARQPSAVLKTREHFWGMPKRGLAFILANAMFWQPLWAQAEGIVVSAPGTSLGQAGNGVPIVNIATPNGSGLSHNQFHDYNVGQQGVILNNATDRTQSTQLGGIIVGNPNLKGVAAQTILNEVNGGSPSQLRGYTEVAGQSAHVIVANPYGISCNGCGFINTPKATLTTGKPVIENGQLSRYQVDQGQVTIDGATLNASNVDSFEIITRSARINAEIQAKNLTIVTGRNDVDARTLNATARADDGSAKPELAIDSSALGGMYAGAIKLVGTEAGVGVKLDGKLIASGGDIQLDANGQLRMVDASAANGAVKVTAASLDAQGSVHAGSALTVQTQGDLNNRQNLTARDSISLSAGGRLTNSGIIEAGVNADNNRNANGDVSLSAQHLDNSGKSVIASRNLRVNAAQALNNQGGTLSAGQSANINAATLDNQSKGRVLSSGSLDLTSGQVLNDRGLISGDGNLSATLGHLKNHDGEVSSAGITTLTATSLDNSDGQVTGDVALNIGLIGALNNQSGVLGSGKRVSIDVASLDNSHAGSLVSDGVFTARIKGLFDNQNGDLSAKGAVDLQTGSLDNRNGSLTGKDRLTLNTASLDNRGGKVRADQDLQLDVGQLDNREKGLLNGQAAVNFKGTHLDNRGGLLSAVGPVRLDAASVANGSGHISSQTDLIAAVGQFTNQAGELTTKGNLTLSGSRLDNTQGGLVGATKGLKLSVDQVDNRGGEISSAVDVHLEGQRLDNSASGKILAGTELGLKVAQLINQSQGLLFGKGATTVTGQSLDNSGGRLVTQQGLDIRLDNALSNIEGLISSEGGLTLKAASLDNHLGNLSSAGALALTTVGALANQGGSITTDGGLTLASQSLDNSHNGLLSGKGVTRVDTGTFDNTQGGRLISSDTLDLSATQVSNGAASRIASDQALTASVSGFDQQGGELFSKISLSLDLNQGQLNNQKGLINAPLLMLKNLKDVNNQGGEISSAQAFTLAARNLDNSNGKLIGNQGLTLRIEQALNSLKGLVSAQTLEVHSASLDNTDGLISSRGTLGVTVGGQLVNRDGTFIADGDLNLSAGSLDNSSGQIAGKTEVTANVASLNNQGGELIATGGLSLTGINLDNRLGGLVGATNALQLKVESVDNRGGELSSKSGVTLVGKRLDNSDGGQVFAEGGLELTVDHVLNRAKGLLSGKSGLTLTGSGLDNQGGSLLTQQALLLDLQGDLDNRQGLLSAEGTLGVKAASLDNSAGSVSSAGALTVTSRGALTNQGGEIVTDAGLTLKSASLDNRNNGSLSAKGAVTVESGAVDNSHGGRLNSGADLTLTAEQLTNQDTGRIASAGKLTASVTGLDQQGGQLFSNTALDLDLNHGQLNNQNGLINAPLLMLKNLKGVDNRGGEISSAQAFSLVAERLANDNGKLLSNQGLTLRIDQVLSNLKGLIAAAALDVKAASLDNSGGTLTSRANLELNLDGLLNNQNLGLVNAATNLNINSSGLNNQGGSLLGSAIAIDFGAASGDLNNNAGLITTAGTLSIEHLRDLNNQGGEISSSQSLDLNARDLNNGTGKLISNQSLAVNGNSVLNQGGLISGWQGLNVTAASLDNRNQGTLSSRSGDVQVSASGAILNSGAGALVSQKTLNVSAASLDNSSGGILSSGAAQSLTIGGLLNNAQGGLIDSGATLSLQAMTLGNAAGTVNAQQALDFTGTSLDNSSGNLAGNGAVTLNLLGGLLNSNGKLASAGPLRLLRSTHIDNQGGQLASQGLMTLLTGGLDNRNRGTVAANDQLTLTSSGVVQNSADGLIYSQNGGLQVQAVSLVNTKGTLQSQGALNLNVGGDIDNQSGRILAKAGDLAVTAGNLDNRGGVLSSLQGMLTTQLSGVLKNGYDLGNNRQGGIAQAQRLNLIALGGIDNYGGRIAAQSGDAIVNTHDFDNRNGGLYAKGRVKVSGNNFDNSGDNDGQIAGNQIDLDLTGALNNRLGIIESDSTLVVKAASLDNQTGKLRALGTAGKTDFQIGGLFDNRNGILESANHDLSLGVGSFLNGGGSLLHVGTGTFDISTANVTGAGGSIVTRGGLTLNADSWSNSNVIQAGRLNVNVNNFNQTASGQLLASESLVGSGVNWFNEGLIASDGSLSVGLSGAYWGAGRLSSLGTLDLSAAQVSLNSTTSSIAGGGDTRLNVGGQLDNAGRLTSAAGMTIVAGGVRNYATLGAGGDLTLTTGALSNDHGLIFSGGDMGLRVDVLNNSYADIYSLGNLIIDRDGQGSLASSIVNSSASLQSDGSMSLAASTIQNVRAVLEVKDAGIYTARITELPCSGKYVGDCKGGNRNGLFEVVQRSKMEVGPGTSAASSISTGANLTLRGDNFLNSSSAVGAVGNLSAQFVDFTNKGVEIGDTEESRTYVTARKTLGGHQQRAAAFTQQYWHESSGYDSQNLGGLEAALANFIGKIESEVGSLHKTTQLATGDQSYSGVIQAGGVVNVNASNNIDNSVVRPGYIYVGSGAKTNTAAPGSEYSTRLTLNQQLPPNLAQQQVNPLALPGFSLPTGQNGLFRLSGASSSTPTSSGPQSWTMGGASLDTVQRQQALPVGQAREIQLGNVAQVTASSVELNPVSHQATNIGTNASAINTTVAGPDPVSGATLPGRSVDQSTQAGALTINRVQGLPDNTVQSKPHKYLIETNPVLTDLKQFMSSDYLLSNIGYDPDQSAKRLGDGLYEQKLIQQAVVARTGQRFIDGQTSDEALFKYLMNNAIASKQELDLRLGVSLTSEQVAALTHDIVWMENAEVNGEQVLVPVLYLANANNRLAPNGALIAGSDVNLIAGQDLHNAGTLRASNNLSANAGNDLVNSGLVEAGNRLNLLAGNNLVNKAGGIISGRDVSLTATRGDVINERTVTTHESSSGYRSERTDFVDSAARIEAANNLTIKAGRDLDNSGGVLKSGADTTINAGRDINLASAEQIASRQRGVYRDQTITQYGSSIEAGRDLTATAGRDLNAIASQIDAKRDITMAATDDLTLSSAANEQHSYNKTKKVTSQEDHVSQVSTTLNAGGSVALSAGKDLGLIASRVSAGDEAYLYAGNDLNLETAENSDYSYYSKTKKGSWGKKSSKMTESESDVAVSSSIEAGKKVVISAVQDINAEGAKVTSAGALLATAGRDINLEAAENYASQASASSKKGLFSSKSNSNSSSQTTLTTTELVGQSIDLRADNDISLKAAALRAEGAVKLKAGNDVEIGTAEVHQASSQSKQSGKVGMTVTGWVSATQKAQQAQQSASQSIGSDISADSLQITSGRDTSVRGSTLVTDQDLRIDAGRNLEVVSAENTSSANSKSSSKKVGEVGSWWQGATGIVKQKGTDQSDTTRQSGSQIASLGGNVSLNAGEHYNQVASQVVAPKGDIDIKAKQVDIQAGFDTLKANNTASTSRTAIGGSVSVPVLDALRSLQDTVKTAKETSDSRMLALSAVNAAMSANQALESGQALMQKNLTGVKISVNLSDSRSHRESSQSGRNVVGSSVVAGGNVNISAKGAGADSNLNVVGSRIEAGGDANLKADGKINLLAAQNTAHQESSNGNSGWSAGIGFSFGGQQNGFSLDLAANKGRGNSNGDDVTQTNTSIKAGQTVRLDSGGDTNLKGAVVVGEQVQAKVGGDLNIESLQDTSTYRSEQMNASVGVSICIPPFCYGMSSVSGGIAQQKMHSDYASVSEQSGIKARDGGFQVEVKGNTDLKGAVIASTDKAVVDGKNTLTTGSLTSSDIKNKADYDATSINLSGGYSVGGKVGRDADGNVDATKNGTSAANKGGFGVNAPVALYAGGSSSSKTLSGISGAVVTITDNAKQQALTGQTAEQAVAAINTDVSSDRDGSNKLKPIFDAKEIQVGFEITGKFIQNASMYLESRAREVDATREQADKEYAAAHNQALSDEERQFHRDNYFVLKERADTVAKDWGAGGTYRQIATALVAGASGNVTGGGSQFAQNMFVNYVQQQGSDYIGKLVLNGLKEGSPEHAGLHAILGCAGAAASNQSCSAGALGGSASSVLAGLFNETDPNETNEEREAKRNIIASVVTGIAAMSNPNGAATATNAAIANVDNNWLATQQLVQFGKEFAEAQSATDKIKVAGKWLSISGNQDLITGSALFKSFRDGMAGAGIDLLNGSVGVLRDPMASVDAMKEFAASADGRKILGAAYGAFQSQLNQISEALQKGGDANAENLGKQLGQALSLYAQIVATGGTGAAKGAATLSKAGIEVSSSGMKEIAASTKAAGGLEGKLATLERVGPDPDVPQMPGKDGGPLVYLSNSSAPEIRDRLALAIREIRRELPREGNAAFAEVKIDSLSSEVMVMKSYSQFDARVGEFLPKPSGDMETWVLKPQSATSRYIDSPESYLRDMDTEFKILETLAQRLGDNSLATGRINLMSEKMVCPSCTDVIRQFRERYPKIQLNIFTVEK
ncbi:hemagglutinin repeat-containing protein [Pseudomonas chlororaphis]|uniref:hemagglutinin repeat-containing protein n=1 Tax=Pseudomonas chlororaphis TaxID=587753 RepID=UPI0023689BFB|nr:hemagglutinin repeat-containing protein [Pseudomonas chlororaphis]WDH56027.1 hemagglutinin repeat-containing protein [Pseudomonas chlororaphis]